MGDTEVAGLVGRQRELDTVNRWLRDVDARGVGALLRGPAGIGTSALLRAILRSGAKQGLKVLSISGTRSETGVAFAGLYQLLQPLLDRIWHLTGRQRGALVQALGRRVPLPHPFLIGAAVLELFAGKAQEAPLLVVADDGHGLDEATAEVLGFVARRVESIPIVMLIAVRDGHSTPLVDFGLPELRVGPMTDESAELLLDLLAPGLGPQLRRRVLAGAAGYPLALVELAAGIDATRSGSHGIEDRLPLTDRLQQTLLDRFVSLPASTRTMLLIASADEHAQMSEVMAAAGVMLDQDGTAHLDLLSPALATGLVRPNGHHIRFGHPLLPTAIYRAATPTERQQAHAALAATLVQRDRRAWHWAASIPGPNENLAEQLERAALGAAAGATELTLASLERAAELTVETSRRPQRLLRAAELAVDLGQPERAVWLLNQIDPARCPPLDRARMTVVRNKTDPVGTADPAMLATLIDEAARAGSAGDVEPAIALLQAAATCAWWADPGPSARNRIVDVATRIPARPDDPCLAALLAICDPPNYTRILYQITRNPPSHACDPKAAYWLGSALHASGEFPRAATFFSHAIAGLRDQNNVWLLTQALAQQASVVFYTGNWALAAAISEQAASLALETHQPLWAAAASVVKSMIAAIRGELGAAESLLARAESIALPSGASRVLADIRAARALIDLAAGRYEEAFQHLQCTFDPQDAAWDVIQNVWRIGDYAEAAVHSGHRDQARQQLITAELRAKTRPSARLDVALLHARVLLANDDDAEALFQTALRTNLTDWPFDRARLLLEYGTWLRRQRRIASARTPLRTALDAFHALDASPWAERAHQELRASRETRRHQPEGWIELSEQEQQIARLAADGLTNRQIAQSLYLSHRTVGSHLYRIYPKLGVASRTQLPLVLGEMAHATMAS